MYVSLKWFLLLGAMSLLSSTGFAHYRQQQQPKLVRPARHSSSSSSSAPRPLPPPPPGVTDLKFSEFYTPVAGRGLAATPKLTSLNGKRVRILGYMVKRDQSPPGVLLLAARPVQLHDREYGLADDLPPALIYVSVPTRRGQMVPYTPGLLLLTGVLSVGSREEPDGRISYVRLALDSPPPATPRARKTAPAKRGARTVKAAAPK